jgi:hypothetical protein
LKFAALSRQGNRLDERAGLELSGIDASARMAHEKALIIETAMQAPPLVRSNREV